MVVGLSCRETFVVVLDVTKETSVLKQVVECQEIVLDVALLHNELYISTANGVYLSELTDSVHLFSFLLYSHLLSSRFLPKTPQS